MSISQSAVNIIDVSSLPKCKWRSLLNQYKSNKKLRKRFQLLRQAVKKSKLFLVQKTVKSLRNAQERLQQASQANDEQLRNKRIKSVSKYETNLTHIKGVDLDQITVAAMLRMYKQGYVPILNEDNSDSELVAVMRLICESSTVTAAIAEIQGIHKSEDDEDDNDSDGEEIDEVDRLPRKNRPGQRARRMLSLKKYGNKSNFLNAKPAEAKATEHPSWTASKLRKTMASQLKFNGVKTKFE